MAIPSHWQWMQDTAGGFTKPRSAKLKVVDEAILQYERTKNSNDIWRIRNAFEDWKRSEGPTWDKSLRNRTGAVTRLNVELDKSADYRTYQITHFTMQELMALQFVAKERKKVIATIFEDKEVTFKAAKLKEQLKKSADEVKETAGKGVAYLKSIGKNAPAAAGPSASETVKKKMMEMVKAYFGVEGIEQLGSLAGLILSLLEQAAVSIPPVVGHIKDGYDLFTEWAKVGSGLYKQHNIAERQYTIDTGAPTLAFNALQVCLKDETKNEAISATRATTSFALKTGLAFVDGGAISGPVVGAANALAEFAHNLYLLGMEWRSTKAINKALAAGELDIRLFRTYPLMGCYLLISATLSDMIPIESFGTPGWMDYIENMKKHAFDEIYSSATELVEKSPWEISGLPKRPKGTTGGVFSSISKIFSTVSPLSDLKDLKDLPGA